MQYVWNDSYSKIESQKPIPAVSTATRILYFMNSAEKCNITIILWTMMTFPGLPDQKIREFERQREKIMSSVPISVVQELKVADDNTEFSTEAQDLKGQLEAIDAGEAEASLRNSIASHILNCLHHLLRALFCYCGLHFEGGRVMEMGRFLNGVQYDAGLFTYRAYLSGGLGDGILKR